MSSVPMHCEIAECQTAFSWFRARIHHQHGYLLDSAWYCGDSCLKQGVLEQLERCTTTRDNATCNPLRAKLGLILLESGVITKEELNLAIAVQRKEQRERFGYYLQALDFASERDITLALGRQSHLPVIQLTQPHIPTSVLNVIPTHIAQASKCFPLEYDEDARKLTVVTCDPGEIPALVNLRTVLRCDVCIYLSDDSVVRTMIDQYCALSKANRVTEEIRNGRTPGELVWTGRQR